MKKAVTLIRGIALAVVLVIVSGLSLRAQQAPQNGQWVQRPNAAFSYGNQPQSRCYQEPDRVYYSRGYAYYVRGRIYCVPAANPRQSAYPTYSYQPRVVYQARPNPPQSGNLSPSYPPQTANQVQHASVSPSKAEPSDAKPPKPEITGKDVVDGLKSAATITTNMNSISDVLDDVIEFLAELLGLS